MILTNKAKEDFETWLYSNDVLIKDGIFDDTYLAEVLDKLPLNLQYACIIEWLDSVGIYISSYGFEFTKEFYSAITSDNFSVIKPTRQEALIEAIKKS